MNNENNNVTGTNLTGNTGIPVGGPIPNGVNPQPTPSPIPNLNSSVQPGPEPIPANPTTNLNSPVTPINNPTSGDSNFIGNATPLASTGINPTPNSLEVNDALNSNNVSNSGPTPGTFFNSSSVGPEASSGINSGVSPTLGTENNQVNNNSLDNNAVNPIPPVNNPEPAFTNPQSIVGNAGNTNNGGGAMPGFESANTIGTTPPISLESEGQPQQAKKPKGNNKLPFIIIVVFVLGAVGFGTYYVLNYTNLINKKHINAGTTITVKPFEVNLGDKLSTNVDDYATVTGTASTNCSVDTSKVDTNIAGTYEFTVICGEQQQKGSLTVVDNTELAVELKTVYKTVGDTITANEFAKDPNDGLVYNFLDQTIVTSNLNTAGVHKVTLKVSQNVAGAKESNIEGRLVVLAYPVKGYLTCSSEATPNTENTYTLTTSEQFAIVDKPDLESAFGDLAFEINKFVFTKEEDYLSNIATYKSSGSLTIGNKTGDVTYNDEEHSITLTSERDNNSLTASYGADNITTYRTLYTYFRQTMQYTCTFEK